MLHVCLNKVPAMQRQLYLANHASSGYSIRVSVHEIQITWRLEEWI